MMSKTFSRRDAKAVKIFSEVFRAFLLLAGLSVSFLEAGYLSGRGDFEDYYLAAAQLLKGLNPYAFAAFPSATSPFGLPAMPLALWLTFIPSLFSFPTAYALWDVICLLLWACAFFLWMTFLWKEPVDVSTFAKAAIACAIAPLYWAFQAHQLIVLVFFFATLAYWMAIHRAHPMRTGLVVGLALMKPHLTALLALALFFKSRRKLLFSLGVAAGLLLPCVPFMNVVRPPSDLRDWLRAIDHYRTSIYFSDEQSLPARLFALGKTHLGGRDLTRALPVPGVLIPVSSGQKYHHFKTGCWILGAALWAVFWFRNKSLEEATLYALTLAWGLLISIYSHFYDGVLMIPLVLLALRAASVRWKLSNLFGIFFAFHCLLAFFLPYGPHVTINTWMLMGWTSILYATLCLLILWI